MRKTRRRRVQEANSIGAGLMLAPMVAMMRLPLMAMEARSGEPWSAETARAVTEKTVAMAEGAVAAQMSFLQSASRFWPEVLSGHTPSLLNGVAAERSISAALKPASRAVKANFRRLSSKA
ncbi:hypothetical protein FKO01_11815 [Mesorhizobium sp. B2-3-3]|uniref:hypothetical protein n=1 Tax=unclassified Mesorhizobium TaxID=325217 RepID=UPI00112EB461|nr:MULTISPECIES: hypothetical protein [unclassified Mesorhizobium]TPK64685.1 hypothetical protein FJ930_25270 [Mesorhizobium sp. B2-4-15]TPM34801.1 hypothetical protein FJ958_06790 [Mesorhizobium sp. B2-3-5]TPN34113.1 hypothetical protein FKO01_11815 [Mesorhizobium sp. B2-3-3]